MAEAQEISTKEQLAFLDEQVKILESLSAAFSDEPDMHRDAKYDLAVTKAIREKINFEYLLEQRIAAEGFSAALKSQFH
jgi:hypothetical protein